MTRVVAVDLDEVLGQFVHALCQFHNEYYGTSLKLSDFLSYTFREVWGGSDEEAVKKVHEFFKSNFFQNIQVVRGAVEGIKKLQNIGYELVVVTSRQLVIEQDTRKWISKHFGEDSFKDIAFGNHWGLQGRKITKTELCQQLGASVLIDDSLSYTTEVASAGIKALLFDLDGTYGWNKEKDQDNHLPVGVTRVYNWDDVVEHLKYE